MIRKLVVNDGRSERELLLVGTIVVGRDPTCHINDMDPLLSRRHAEFTAGTREVTVRDLGSRNGILVNGVKKPQAALQTGDVVQIGHLQVKYLDEVGPFLDIPGLEPVVQPTIDLSEAAPTVRLAPVAVTRELETSLGTDDDATVIRPKKVPS